MKISVGKKIPSNFPIKLNQIKSNFKLDKTHNMNQIGTYIPYLVVMEYMHSN